VAKTRPRINEITFARRLCLFMGFLQWFKGVETRISGMCTSRLAQKSKPLIVKTGMRPIAAEFLLVSKSWIIKN
jgi:hypothetical protein